MTFLGGFLHLLINSLYAPECSSSEPVAEQKEHKGSCLKKHSDDPQNSPRHLWTDEAKVELFGEFGLNTSASE